MLYTKGLILETFKKDSINAQLVYDQLAKQDSNSIYVSLSRSSMKREIIPQKPVDIPVIMKYSLNNYPNPFNPVTTIGYQLPEIGHVKLQLFDARGRLIKNLVDETKSTGSYTIKWDGSYFSSGVYFLQIRITDIDQKIVFTKTQKMLLTK